MFEHILPHNVLREHAHHHTATNAEHVQEVGHAEQYNLFKYININIFLNHKLQMYHSRTYLQKPPFKEATLSLNISTISLHHCFSYQI